MQHARLHTFLEWEDLLGGDRNKFDFEPLSSFSLGPGVGVPPSDTDFAYLCGADRGETAFLNQPDVRSALHVCSEAECGVFPGEHHWTKPYNYNKTEAEYHEADLYKEFIDHGLHTRIFYEKILVAKGEMRTSYLISPLQLCVRLWQVFCE